jgi:hypothetical protein
MEDLKNMSSKDLRKLQEEIAKELKSRFNTRTAAVIHVTSSGTPIRMARMFITHIPKNVTAQELRYMLDEAGYHFGDYGEAWANYRITIGLRNEWFSVRNAFKTGDVLTISYDELQQMIAENNLIN